MPELTVVEIVKGLEQDTVETAGGLLVVKGTVETLVKGYLASIKKRFGALPDKAVFMDSIAQYIDAQITINALLAKIKISNPVIKFFANAIIASLKLTTIQAVILMFVEAFLDKRLGSDWYEKMKADAAKL